MVSYKYKWFSDEAFFSAFETLEKELICTINQTVL